MTEYIQQRQELKTFKALHVKAVGDMRLEVLGAPFGGPNDGKDDEGEFFSKNTDFMMEIGDKRPVIYYHGMTPRGSNQLKPEVIGMAELKRMDEQGLWFDVVLKEGSALAKRVYEAAKEGIARASSGAVNYLVRVAEKTGEILTWALAELSLFDTGAGRQPANQYAVVNVKSLFDTAGIDYPERFTESGELAEPEEEDDGVEIRLIHKTYGVYNNG